MYCRGGPSQWCYQQAVALPEDDEGGVLSLAETSEAEAPRGGIAAGVSALLDSNAQVNPQRWPHLRHGKPPKPSPGSHFTLRARQAEHAFRLLRAIYLLCFMQTRTTRTQSAEARDHFAPPRYLHHSFTKWRQRLLGLADVRRQDGVDMPRPGTHLGTEHDSGTDHTQHFGTSLLARTFGRPRINHTEGLLRGGGCELCMALSTSPVDTVGNLQI